MFKNYHSKRLSVVLLTLLLVLLASTSLVLAQAEIQGGSTVPGGPAFVSIDASAFIAIEKDHHRDAGANSDLCDPGPGVALFQAPVALPNKVTINKFVLYYYDSSATSLGASLVRRELSGTSSNLLWMDSLYSQGSLGYGNVADTDIISPVVDLQKYSYFVQVSMSDSCEFLRLAGVRIDYEYPTFLAILKK